MLVLLSVPQRDMDPPCHCSTTSCEFDSGLLARQPK